MAICYGAIVIAHYLVLPDGAARYQMMLMALATSLFALFVWRYTLNGVKAAARAFGLLNALWFFILANSALHMYLYDDPAQSPLFALTIVAAGFFFASLRQLLIINGLSILIWWLLFPMPHSGSQFSNYAFLIAMATAVSLLMNVARMSNLRRIEAQREQSIQQLQVVGQNHREFLERVLQSLEPGICVLDSEGYIALVNRAFAALLGATPEALTGRELALHLTDSPLAAIAGQSLEVPLELNTGGDEYVLLHAIPFSDEQASLGEGKMLLAVDISSRKHLEAEREQLLQSVHEAQRLESLGVLAGGVAHDFNNLLAIIVGSLEMLKLSYPNDTHVSAAAQAAGKAADLTRQLLVHAGNDTMIRKPVRVADVIRQAVKLLQSCTPRSIEYVVRVRAQDATVSADRLQLQQVIVNLGLNAAESYPDGNGEVLIALDQVPGPRLAASDTSFVQIKISDNGCGMGEAEMSKLYQPFFSTKGAGRGLGLSASQGIVQRLAGEIEVQSAADAGTTISILLPAETPDPAEVEAAAARRAANLSGKRAWIVDDEPIIGTVGSEMLKRIGMDCLCFSSPEHALASAIDPANVPDVAIIDLNMPGINGIELFADLRELYPDLPVVVISGYDQTQVADTILARASQVGFVRKPFSSASLIEAIGDVLA